MSALWSSLEFKGQILRLEKSPISERLNIRGRIARQTGLDEEKIAHKQLEAAISNKCCIYRQFLLVGQMAPFPVRRMLHAVTCRFGIQDCKCERLVLSSFHRLKKILEMGRQDTIKTQIVQYMKSEILDSRGACCKLSLTGLGPRIVNVSDIPRALGLV